MPFEISPDYKEVAERLRDLFAKHPDASMRGTYELVDGHVIYRAECYRTPDDPAPGVGTAWEEVPGRTPYTKGSELQNAETSAWGRAIVAVGASESKRIASADEMRLANDRRSAPAEPQRPAPASMERVERIKASVLDLDIAEWVKDQGFHWPWTDAACDAIDLELQRVTLLDAQRDLEEGDHGTPAEPVMGRGESLAREAAREPNLDEYSDAPF